MTKRFHNKCRRVGRLVREAQSEIHDLHEMFIERYGVTYNDLDLDDLIDAIDYGGGNIPPMEEIDRMMAEEGHPAR